MHLNMHRCNLALSNSSGLRADAFNRRPSRHASPSFRWPDRCCSVPGHRTFNRMTRLELKPQGIPATSSMWCAAWRSCTCSRPWLQHRAHHTAAAAPPPTQAASRPSLGCGVRGAWPAGASAGRCCRNPRPRHRTSTRWPAPPAADHCGPRERTVLGPPPAASGGPRRQRSVAKCGPERRSALPSVDPRAAGQARAQSSADASGPAGRRRSAPRPPAPGCPRPEPRSRRWTRLQVGRSGRGAKTSQRCSWLT
mmetsp:Transcript_61270/g.200326  ORF Transcript_61270/g.200326 Transcript_61270/m.200326 type:complete len:252 (-) Transcript_61270:89-844(-)